MALIARTEVDEVTTFRCGHPRAPGNIAFDLSGTDHKRRARCQTCKRESVRRSRERNRIVVRTMLMPRGAATTSNGRTRDEVDAYRTAPLIGLVSKALRDDIAAVLADTTIDQLQKNVIRRCATRRKGWISASEDMATRWFLEGLAAETVDARSPLLRIEALVRLVFGP